MMEGGESERGIRAERVHVAIRRQRILHDLTVAAHEGQTTALVGPNGSGKSTFLRTLFDAVPSTGDIQVHGESLRRMPARTRVRRLAVLTQERSFAAGTRTREVVAMGRSARRRSLERHSSNDTHRIREAMAEVRITELAERDVATLSGGERQRAHIARVIAQDADVVVMDEPTNHLDIGHQLSALDLLDSLAHDQGRTVLVALHDLSLAARWADHVAVLMDGEVLTSGPPRDVLTPELIRHCFGVPARWIALEDGERLLLG